MKPSLAVIGLGNPGRAYEQSRHNAGFLALDALSQAFGEGEWKERQKFQSIAQEARIVTVPVLLVKPQTFMNRSGEAVRKILEFYKLDPREQILLCSDDVDLPLGTLRLRHAGGPGTHNGLKSVVEQLGEGFSRLRIGIGPQPARVDLAAWVLSAFPDEERRALSEAFVRLPEMLRSFVMERPQRGPNDADATGTGVSR